MAPSPHAGSHGAGAGTQHWRPFTHAVSATTVSSGHRTRHSASMCLRRHSGATSQQKEGDEQNPRRLRAPSSAPSWRRRRCAHEPPALHKLQSEPGNAQAGAAQMIAATPAISSARMAMTVLPEFVQPPGSQAARPKGT
jgi:hypothetical protein